MAPPGMALKRAALALLGLAPVCAGQDAAALATVLPPIIEFIKNRPDMKILPGNDPNGLLSWFKLKFGLVQEVDANGRPVPGRAIRSLAESIDISWLQETQLVDGTPATVTTMTLPLKDSVEFPSCPAGSGLRRRLQSETAGGGSMAGDESMTGGGSMAGGDSVMPGGAAMDGGNAMPSGDDSMAGVSQASAMDGMESTPGSVTIRVFGFNATKAFEVNYGPAKLEIDTNQLKFNVEATNWPFCGKDHRLEVTMIVTAMDVVGVAKKVFGLWQSVAVPLLAGFLTQRQESRFAQRTQVKAKAFRQRAGTLDFELDLPTQALVDGSMADCEVDMKEFAQGFLSNIKFSFPYFEKTLLYDPTAGSRVPANATANTTEEETTTTTEASAQLSGDGAALATLSGAALFLPFTAFFASLV